MADPINRMNLGPNELAAKVEAMAGQIAAGVFASTTQEAEFQTATFVARVTVEAAQAIIERIYGKQNWKG